MMICNIQKVLEKVFIKQVDWIIYLEYEDSRVFKGKPLHVIK